MVNKRNLKGNRTYIKGLQKEKIYKRIKKGQQKVYKRSTKGL